MYQQEQGLLKAGGYHVPCSSDQDSDYDPLESQDSHDCKALFVCATGLGNPWDCVRYEFIGMAQGSEDLTKSPSGDDAKENVPTSQWLRSCIPERRSCGWCLGLFGARALAILKNQHKNPLPWRPGPGFW